MGSARTLWQSPRSNSENPRKALRGGSPQYPKQTGGIGIVPMGPEVCRVCYPGVCCCELSVINFFISLKITIELM